MSHIFDALRELEDERKIFDRRVASDAVELLEFAERSTAMESESSLPIQDCEGYLTPAAPEPRLRIVGVPLEVGGWSPASVPAHVPDPSEPSTPLPAGPALSDPAEESPLRIREVVTASIQNESIRARPAEESPLEVRQEVSATTGQERIQASPAKMPAFKLPARLQRTVAVLRAALPIVQRILPLLDGQIGTTVSNLLAPYHPAHPAPAPPPVDLSPIEDTLAEFRTQHHELREQVVEQNASLRRIDNQLEMVGEATGRNTRELQELIEELKGVSNKINIVALVALALLAISVATNLVLYLHILEVLP